MPHPNIVKKRSKNIRACLKEKRCVNTESLDSRDSLRVVKILYMNYKLKVALRTVRPIKIVFKSTVWHTEKQWILTAWDLDKHARRDFAMKDILEWDKGRVYGK